jgi:hypothetical protein
MLDFTPSFGAVEFVINRQDGTARIAKNMFDSVLPQAINQGERTATALGQDEGGTSLNLRRNAGNHWPTYTKNLDVSFIVSPVSLAVPLSG